jgi:hypothetical protein
MVGQHPELVAVVLGDSVRPSFSHGRMIVMLALNPRPQQLPVYRVGEKKRKSGQCRAFLGQSQPQRYYW